MPCCRPRRRSTVCAEAALPSLATSPTSEYDDNNPAETQFIADVAARLVGEAHVDRNRSLIIDLRTSPTCSRLVPARLYIGNGDTNGPFHSPATISTTSHCRLGRV